MSIIKTQGLHIWFANPDKGLHKICPTSLDLGDVDYEEIDITTLCEVHTKRTVKGLMNEGETSLGLAFDPQSAAHIALYELAMDLTDPEVKFAIGCATDADVSGYTPDAAPTYDAGTNAFTLPATRHWVTFTGTVNKFPFEMGANEVIRTTVAVKQRTPLTFVKAA